VLPLVRHHFPEYLDAPFISQLCYLFAIFTDIAAFLNFETPESKIGAANAVCQRIGFPGRVAR
jgi:hypothetical protein